jgi:hypothetical protein
MKHPIDSMPQRFIDKVNLSDNCWLWTASTNNFGYGRYKVNGKMIFSHRYSYEHFKGDIPKGLTIDHLCRVRNCVNPAHLEAVTHQENCKRGNVGKNQSDKTHCPQGHEYTAENTYIAQNSRKCRECQYSRNKANRLRKRVLSEVC